jgi:hypothetical protein
VLLIPVATTPAELMGKFAAGVVDIGQIFRRCRCYRPQFFRKKFKITLVFFSGGLGEDDL